MSWRCVLGSGGIINVLLVLALCRENYFVSCNRCCTALSVKQPLIPMYEKLDWPYSKCGYCRKERNLWKIILLFLQSVVWFSYRLLQECICLYLLELLRKIMLVTEKDTMVIRQERKRIFFSNRNTIKMRQ